MRGKDFNCGLRGVLFEAHHCDRMGSAIWLYGWLVLRQTHQCGDIGWVLGGAPVNYREIENETGFNRRTLERWMRILRSHGYVETRVVPSGIIIQIRKAKKFPQPGRNSAEGVRRIAEGARKVAEGGAHSCVGYASQLAEGPSVTPRIGSSSVEAEIERKRRGGDEQVFHSLRNKFPQPPVQATHAKHSGNPFPLGSKQNPRRRSHSSDGLQPPFDFVQEMRMRLQLLRAEREEAVRRELGVGAGPEVKRT